MNSYIKNTHGIFYILSILDFLLYSIFYNFNFDSVNGNHTNNLHHIYYRVFTLFAYTFIIRRFHLLEVTRNSALYNKTYVYVYHTRISISSCKIDKNKKYPFFTNAKNNQPGRDIHLSIYKFGVSFILKYPVFLHLHLWIFL